MFGTWHVLNYPCIRQEESAAIVLSFLFAPRSAFFALIFHITGWHGKVYQCIPRNQKIVDFPAYFSARMKAMVCDPLCQLNPSATVALWEPSLCHRNALKAYIWACKVDWHNWSLSAVDSRIKRITGFIIRIIIAGIIWYIITPKYPATVIHI